LALAGADLLRVTVDHDDSAKGVPHIRDRLAARRVRVPLGAISTTSATALLARHQACAEAWTSTRSTRPNVGFRQKRSSRRWSRPRFVTTGRG
jgi:(E)-4-hydroxy-3-methylbut-2-enyl-diphosphate synthase